MSQLNVDNIANRLGTGGPTVPALTSTGSITVQGNLNVTGITTLSSANFPSGFTVSSGTITAPTFTSNTPFGTAPFTVSSTTKVNNLNADLLDGNDSTAFFNAGNLNAGTVPTARLASGTANSGTFLRGDQTWQPVTSADYNSIEQVSGGTRKSISAIYSITPRQNTLNGWNNGGPAVNGGSLNNILYAYGANGQSDAEQWSWFGLGFIPRATETNYNFGDQLSNFPLSRQQISAGGNRVGSQASNFVYANSNSYNPVSILMIPIRNNSNLSKTITIYGMHSSYWSSGYDGSSLWQYAPGQTGTYSGVTSGTWTNLGQRTGGNSHGYTWSSNMTIPAQTTYVAMQVATSYYWTGSGIAYYMHDQNLFYNLSTTFSDPYIQVDSRMINTMVFADWHRYGLTSTNSYQFFKVYNACADMYGNR